MTAGDTLARGESWKGIHYKGSTFSTPSLTPKREDVVVGQAFLLTLSGREPYEWITCDPDIGFPAKVAGRRQLLVQPEILDGSAVR